MNVNQSAGNSSFQPFLNTNKKSEEKSDTPFDGLFSSMVEVSASKENIGKIKSKEEKSEENSGEIPLEILASFDGNIKKLLDSDLIKDVGSSSSPEVKLNSEQQGRVELLIKDGKLDLDLIGTLNLNGESKIVNHNIKLAENPKDKIDQETLSVEALASEAFPKVKSALGDQTQLIKDIDFDNQVVLKTSKGAIFINKEDAKKFDLKNIHPKTETASQVNITDAELVQIAKRIVINDSKNVDQTLMPSFDFKQKNKTSNLLKDKFEIPTIIHPANTKPKFIEAQNQKLANTISPAKQVNVKDHPQMKVIKESTNAVLSEHRRFLEKMKEKAGINIEVEKPATPDAKPANEVQKFHRTFFDGLLNGMHKNKIVRNGEESVETPMGEAVVNSINGQIITGGENTAENNKSQLISDAKNLESKILNFNSSKIDVEIGESQIENKYAKNAEQSSESKILTRIRANEFVAKTAQNVRALAPNGASVARFHLTPDALGKVFVEINVQSSVATLNIKADNKEVVKLIEKQIGNLIDKLQLSGINTESVNVSQQNFEDAANSREGNSGQKNQEREAREEFLESLKKLKQLNDSDKKRILHGGNNA